VKLTELLLGTELAWAITVGPDVPPEVAEPEEVDVPELVLPLSAMLPGMRCKLLPIQTRMAIPAPPVNMPHKKLRLLSSSAFLSCAYLLDERLLPAPCLPALVPVAYCDNAGAGAGLIPSPKKMMVAYCTRCLAVRVCWTSHSSIEGMPVLTGPEMNSVSQQKMKTMSEP